VGTVNYIQAVEEMRDRHILIHTKLLPVVQELVTQCQMADMMGELPPDIQGQTLYEIRKIMEKIDVWKS
jgi:hypothetical protein